MFNLPQSTTHRLSCTFIFLLFVVKAFPGQDKKGICFPVLLVSLSLHNHELEIFQLGINNAVIPGKRNQSGLLGYPYLPKLHGFI